MSGGVSPSTGRRYPLTMVCTVFRVARSTVYAAPSPRPAVTLGKRGPKTATSDAELVAAIRAVLVATPFHGEGYRKVWARRRFAGIRSSPGRVRRLMGENGLLAPHWVRKRPDKAHDGTITTEAVDVLWGTDMSQTSPWSRA